MKIKARQQADFSTPQQENISFAGTVNWMESVITSAASLPQELCMSSTTYTSSNQVSTSIPCLDHGKINRTGFTLCFVKADQP